MYQLPRFRKRKIFISYHHEGDQYYYDVFSELFCDQLDLVYDHSLDRLIESRDPDYVMRRIRENFLRGASVTIVLCGAETYLRKYVDWEICTSLNQEMGLIGVQLPTLLPDIGNIVYVPDRLYDNIQSGYAIWTNWIYITSTIPSLVKNIEASLIKPKRLIVNSRETMKYNQSPIL